MPHMELRKMTCVKKKTEVHTKIRHQFMALALISKGYILRLHKVNGFDENMVLYKFS